MGREKYANPIRIFARRFWRGPYHSGMTDARPKMSPREMAAWCLIVTWVCLLIVARTQADESFPLVCESVDEVIAVHVGEQTRLVFISSGAIQATRLASEDLHWTASNGCFELVWQDYCWAARSNRAERIVSTRLLTEFWIDGDLEFEGERAAWHDMRRNMRDLKQP